LASGKWSAIANTHVVWPEASKIERKFLWYRINDERFWIRSGTAQPFVVVRKTFERPFALPPLDEQHRIVAEIEKQLTRLDAGTASLNQVQLVLRAYRDSVSEAACMGRLVPTEAELARAGNRKYESGNQLLQRTIRDSPSIRSDSAGADSHALPELSGLRDLPEGWTRATLKQLCPLFIDSAHRTPVYSTEGFPALGPRDMVGGRLKLANARRIDQSEFAIQTRRHIPQPGDIVYSRELSYGWGAGVPSREQL